MKATIAITLANAIFAVGTPLAKRVYVTNLDIKTVTHYVYPDGSPAYPHGGAPTPVAGEVAAVSSVAKPVEAKPTPAPIADAASNAEEAVVEKPAEAVVQKPAAPKPVDTGYTRPSSNTPVEAACLDAHNVHRSNHTAPAVTWDEDLASYAQQLSDSCKYGHDQTIGGGGYGQNIAKGSWTNFDLTEGEAGARAITRQWYNNEFELYPGYGTNPNMATFEEWGHLSQIVWAGTTKIGCGVSLCKDGKLSSSPNEYITVCNYSPAGNVVGAFDKNVKAPTGAAVVYVE
ncbi:uncharacterized protein DNG_03076 [Cephalotrichum gorgonifer]|uniref:SCP domain-containing protein n=1 Tax=Cephalotrichum gorgonifer TaxID=2041049 RepID=A0AAE8STA8_9PEZI|nr:uncharacterized protein DNG_03076 [Cephalotrichum gorgonifer]